MFPVEVHCKILNYLPLHTLQCLLVCKSWNQIATPIVYDTINIDNKKKYETFLLNKHSKKLPRLANRQLVRRIMFNYIESTIENKAYVEGLPICTTYITDVFPNVEEIYGYDKYKICRCIDNIKTNQKCSFPLQIVPFPRAGESWDKRTSISQSNLIFNHRDTLTAVPMYTDVTHAHYLEYLPQIQLGTIKFLKQFPQLTTLFLNRGFLENFVEDALPIFEICNNIDTLHIDYVYTTTVGHFDNLPADFSLPKVTKLSWNDNITDLACLIHQNHVFPNIRDLHITYDNFLPMFADEAKMSAIKSLVRHSYYTETVNNFTLTLRVDPYVKEEDYIPEELFNIFAIIQTHFLVSEAVPVELDFNAYLASDDYTTDLTIMGQDEVENIRKVTVQFEYCEYPDSGNKYFNFLLRSKNDRQKKLQQRELVISTLAPQWEMSRFYITVVLVFFKEVRMWIDELTLDLGHVRFNDTYTPLPVDTFPFYGFRMLFSKLEKVEDN